MSEELGNSSEQIQPPAEFRRVVFYSVLGGLTPFIPLPFLDDWALNRLKCSMVAGILQRHEIPHNGKQVRILALGPEEPMGCLRLLIRIPVFIIKKVVIYLIKRIIRKLFFVFNIRWSGIVVAECFERGFLAVHAIEAGVLTVEPPPSDEQLVRVHEAIAATTDHVDTVKLPVQDVVTRTFKESKGTLREAGRMLDRIARRLRAKFGRGDQPADEDPDFDETESVGVAALTDALANALWQMPDYLQNRRDLFDQCIESADMVADGQAENGGEGSVETGQDQVGTDH